MSENFQTETDQEKEVLNGAEQDAAAAQENQEKSTEEPREETAQDKLARSEAVAVGE